MQATNISQNTGLNKTLSRLANDARKLSESKTAATLQKALARVTEDYKLVKSQVEQVLMNDEVPHDEAPKSTVKQPVQFVHKYLDRNPTLSRKEAIDRLRAKGVNVSTARTQYHKWKKDHK